METVGRDTIIGAGICVYIRRLLQVREQRRIGLFHLVRSRGLWPIPAAGLFGGWLVPILSSARDEVGAHPVLLEAPALSHNTANPVAVRRPSALLSTRFGRILWPLWQDAT